MTVHMPEPSPARFDETHDVVVVGSGAAGMATALVCRAAGLDVVLLEKTEYFGGSTAISGGAMWVPGNRHAREIGIEDSREAVLAYLRAIVGNRLHQELIDAFLDQGPKMVEFMEKKTALRFVPRQYSPDYRPDTEGAALGGRTLDPAPFDGRELGEHFDDLRPPLDSFLAFGGMMVGRADIDSLLGSFSSVRDFTHSLSLLARYARDRLGYKRGTRLLMGNALAARLLKSALDAGIDMRLRTSVETLVFDDGKVVGLKSSDGDGNHTIGARLGVVLATGGFPNDSARMKARVPHADEHWTMSPSGNRGEGIAMGLAAGGILPDDNAGSAFWAPVSVMKNRDGTETRFPHLIMDRQKPGLIAINSAGYRFVNEAASYHDFVEAMHRTDEEVPTVPAMLICDHAFLRRYGMGLVRPGPRSLRPFIESGYLIRARTIRELAGKLSIDADALEATVRRANDYARSGEDPEFGKGSTAYNRYLGDPRHKPNPCLGPIEKPPFYSVRVYPGDIGTATGLAVDAKARVLDRDGQPIPGLYAAGNDMNSIMAGTYPGAGITLGPALTFGYIAGQTLAEQKRASSGNDEAS